MAIARLCTFLRAAHIGTDVMLANVRAPKELGIAGLGKHHRVLVSSNGKTVVSVEPLATSVIEVPLALLPVTVPGGDPWITQRVTAWLLEMRVFVSLWHQTPVLVGQAGVAILVRPAVAGQDRP